MNILTFFFMLIIDRLIIVYLQLTFLTTDRTSLFLNLTWLQKHFDASAIDNLWKHCGKSRIFFQYKQFCQCFQFYAMMHFVLLSKLHTIVDAFAADHFEILCKRRKLKKCFKHFPIIIFHIFARCFHNRLMQI